MAQKVGVTLEPNFIHYFSTALAWSAARRGAHILGKSIFRNIPAQPGSIDYIKDMGYGWKRRRVYGWKRRVRARSRWIGSAKHRKLFPWFYGRPHPIKGRIPHLPYKRLESTTGAANITTTVSQIDINPIPEGTSVEGERREQKVRLHNWHLTGTILWDTGTPGSYLIRIIVCSCKSTYTGTGITLTANIYDKRDFPDIGHVYKDFRVIRGHDTEIQRKLRMGIRRFRRAAYYDDDAGTDYSDNGYNRISIFLYGSLAAGNTALTDVYSVLHYQG